MIDQTKECAHLRGGVRGEVEERHKMIIPRWLADELGISDKDERYIVVEFSGWEYHGEAPTEEE